MGKLFNPFVDREKEEFFLRELRRLALSLLEGRECTLYLFGSRARGDFFRSSDADLAVKGLSEEEFCRFKWELEEALKVNSSAYPDEVKDLIESGLVQKFEVSIDSVLPEPEWKEFYYGDGEALNG